MGAKKKKGSEEPLNRTIKILEELQKSSCDIQMMDSSNIEDVPGISSGIFSLDLALGGGYPQGRIVEIYGPEGGGKTTVALHAMAAVQANNGVTAMIDVEHAYDPTYGEKLGIDHRHMLFSQPQTGEAALNLVLKIAATMKAGDLIVVDSVANLVPKAELDGEMGDHHVGLHARLMSQAMRKLVAAVSHSEAVLIFINQIRHKIGVTWGSPETTTGGNALKFYASQRLDVRYIGKLKEKDARDNPIGHMVKVKVVKNKVAPPFREVELKLYYGYGFLKAADIFTIGVKEKIIETSGSWYSLNGTRLGQGAQQSQHFLADKPELMNQIKEAVVVKYDGRAG